MALTFKRSNTKEEPIETEFLTLHEPPKELSDNKDQIEEIESRFKRRSITLKDDVKRELESKLYYEIQDWKDSRSSLKTKLREWNDLYEGAVQVTDFPWPGASQLHVPIPKIKAREIKATINRNTMRPVPFLMTRYAGPDALYSSSRDVVNDIEDFIEDKIKAGTNVHQVLKEAIIPTIRDGTCPVQIIWETELERVTDYKIYESVSDFLVDYPDAESAGISTKQFSHILAQLNNKKRYEIQYEYDMAIYDGPKAYLVPLIDFFHWPVFETELSHTLTHGKRIWYKDYDLEKYAQIGKFKEEVVTEINKGVGDIHDDESLTIARDSLEGINRNINATTAKEFECYELIHRVDLDGDGVKEKYLVYYHFKSKKILRIEKYPIRKGATTYFPLRLIKRDNRFLGISLIDDISDLSLEIDILHRMRINSRTITHVPTFKAKESAKDRFDPSRPQFRFQPGATFWLADINDVEQFDINPVDLSGSIEEENFLLQLVGMVTGADSGLSGQSNPLDPRAPARKQQELLRQSSNRIDDYVEALLGPFAQIGQHMIDLYYQYGEDKIKYYVSNENQDLIQKEIDRSKLYDANVQFVVNGTSVFMSPEVEFDRTKEIYQILESNPLTAQDPMVQKEILTRVLDTSRIKDTKNLLPGAGTIGAVTKQTPGGPIIPTQNDAELETKMALARQKQSQRLIETTLSQKHTKDMTLLEAQLEATHTGNEHAMELTNVG